MTSSFRLDHYHINSCLPQNEAKTLLSEVLNGQPKYSVYKDNHKSLVQAWTSHQGHKLIYKQPREQYKGWLQLLMNQFKTTEARDLFNSLVTLNNLGYPAPRPILVAEKKKFGFILNGFLIYEHLDARKANPNSIEDLKSVAKALIKLHQQGFIRKDPRPHNFLISPSGQALFIDCNLRKPLLFSRLRRISEFHKLYRHHPEVEQWLDEKTKKSLYYRAIKAIKTALRNARPGKKKLP